MARQINSEGLNLIKQFEGFCPNFYNDSVVSPLLFFTLTIVHLRDLVTK